MSKKKQKSIEELLEEALVPEEEQPYSLPENWVWVRLKSINKDKKRNIDPRDYSEEVFELYSVPSYDLGEPEYIKGKEIGSNKQVVKENEILLCKINPRINRVWIVLNNRGKYRQLASTEWIVISENKVIYPKYLLFLLKAPYFRKLITSNVSGVGGSLTRAKPKEVETYPIALPPLNEQKRIAEKVELLFAKIDEAKRLIEEVKESFEFRRMAILKSVFRGELIKFNVSFKKLGSIVTLKSGKSLSEDDLLENGEIPYIKVSDMNSTENKREIVTSNKFIKDNEKVSKNLFPKGTVIFPKRGGAIHTNKKRILSTPAVCDLNIMGIICPPTINPYYMYYWMQTIDLGSLDNGSSVPQINNKDIEPLLFPLTSIENQNKVVKLLDSLFEKEEKFIEIIESELIKLDLMKQSILDKAFRGELGTNDPTEESAIELLKEALKSK